MEQWPQARGRIVNVAHGDFQHEDVSSVIGFVYDVGGEEYAGQAFVTCHCDNTFAINGEWIAARPGSELTVYYDPLAPATSALEVEWTSPVTAVYGGVTLVSVGLIASILGRFDAERTSGVGYLGARRI
jgi:hypothetical protein